MLIGNRWIENTRLKILNAVGISAAGWNFVPGQIDTNLSEKGILKGLYTGGGNNAGAVVGIKVCVDDQPLEQGYYVTFEDFTTWNGGNAQPCTMPMPEMDIPSDSTVRLMISQIAGAAVELHFALYMLAYYVKDFEAALPGVCFPTDVAAPGQV